MVWTCKAEEGLRGTGGKSCEKERGGEALERAVVVEVSGCPTPGNLRRTERQCVEEDLAILAIREAEVRKSFRCIIDNLTLI